MNDLPLIRSTRREYEFHPAANLFPMLDDEKLAELAADIASNGQALPILIDAAELIVDGRNRYKACGIAGVEPWFETIEPGTDPLALVVSLNVKRRQLTKGQTAIAAGEAWVIAEDEGRVQRQGARTDKHSPKVGKGLITNPRDHFAKLFGVNKAYVEMARDLVRDDPAAARAVKNGADLREQHGELQSRLGKVNNQRHRLTALRAERPDLADAVDDETISLDDAEATAKADAAALKQLRWAMTCNLVDALDLLDPQPAEAAAATVANFDPSIAEQKSTRTVSVARLRNAARFLSEVADIWEGDNEKVS